MPIKLRDILEVRGKLKVLTSGLRIGGSKEAIGLGETDNPVIRHPITGLPYVPGSSIKGKLRSMLESKYCPGTQQDGLPCKCGNCVVCQLFGCGDSKNIKSPSRLVFRDCPPTDETRNTWEQAGVSTEIKTEVLIDRNKGLSYGRIGPRTMERIPAGSEFHFAFSLRYFEGDDVPGYLRLLAEGFELVEKHYLGGSGSRGYGHVAFVAEDGKPMAEHLRQLAANWPGGK
ncbi:MAG: type III-A CRISPR-associated RAMP protein Csm3 [Thermoguttaceae bacterium]|nr:type III-A CRISPR-associated RAMP protein Csm3 [Thermoguttaceae bacterium]MDW8080164.1 type III-A CRISPR-associated RAMP protein Csm3 [Thermoguttaceae bacterium]